MGLRKDLTGQTFGRLRVILFDRKDNAGHMFWLCQCECGKQTHTRTDTLASGMSQSCGCLAREVRAKINTIHGRCANGQTNGDETYVSWHSMKQRCYDPNIDENHKRNYQDAGVSVCERWIDSFSNFVEDMGERPKRMTLDRINPFGNYEPSNCRWTDSLTQNHNTRHARERGIHGRFIQRREPT